MAESKRARGGGLPKNPNFSEHDRRLYYKTKIMEERQKAVNLWQQTNAQTDPQRLRDYVNKIKKSDHIPLKVAVGVITNITNIPPRDGEEWSRYKKAETYICQLKIRVKDSSGSIAIGRSQATNPVTGDREYIIFNADKESELDEQTARIEAQRETMKKRNKRVITNVRKQPRVRKKLMRQEQMDNYIR